MEEALYDTCILIDEYKKGVRRLKGYTTILNVVEYPKALEIAGLRVIYPSHEDYRLALAMAVKLIRLGKPVSAVDLVVAAAAVNRGLELWTCDSHFRAVREMEDRLALRLVKPR